MKKILIVSVGILMTLLMVSCASTKFTGTWVDENYSGGPIKSIMVVGVAENPRNRKIFEAAMAKQFEQNGVNAVPSEVALGGQEINKDNLIEAATKENVEAVLVTRVVGVDKEQVYYPPTVYTVPDPYYYRWDTYYPRMYDYVDSPGYMATYEYVNLETNVYDLTERKLIWSAASETFDPTNVNKVVEELAKKLVRRMQGDKIL
jgi:hypothetical protein